MKKLFPFLLILVSACNTKDEVAACIEEKITELSDEFCSTGATVSKYRFQNQTTYAVHFGSCIADYHELILDESCDTLGLIGGFGGFTDINGLNYYDNATLEEVVWEN